MKEFDCEGGYYEYSSDVQAVVDLFGVVDTVQMLKDGEDDAILKPLLKNDNIPIDEMAKKASCLTYITENAPPFLIAHGAKDKHPVSASRNFYEKLKEAGCDAVYYEEPNGAHGFDSLEFYMTLTDFIEGHGKK